MVGIVVVSHSADLAEGLTALASQMAGPDVRIEPAGGLPDGSLGTDEDRVRAAIRAADPGAGVVVTGNETTADQITMWLEGVYHIMPWSREAVRTVARNRIELLPLEPRSK